MAINELPLSTTSELSEIFKCHTGNRAYIWLWLCLYIYERLDLPADTCNGLTMKKAIAKVLEGRHDILQDIPDSMDSRLVPDETLRWITHDERQLHWLTPAVEQATGAIIPHNLAHLTGRDYVVAMLDLWKIDLCDKVRVIGSLKGYWRLQVAQDRQLEWFRDKKEGLRRCLCAQEWLEKHYPKPFHPPLINNYQDLVCYFDQASFPSYELKLVIQEIKRRWARKQFDARNTDKKQVNVILPNSTISQLDLLAKRHNLKRAEVVEILLNKETQTGAYLSDI